VADAPGANPISISSVYERLLPWRFRVFQYLSCCITPNPKPFSNFFQGPLVPYIKCLQLGGCIVENEFQHRQIGGSRMQKLWFCTLKLYPSEFRATLFVCMTWTQIRHYRRTSISGTTLSGKKCLSGTISMLFDLTIPCYLTTCSGKTCLSGKVICSFFCPAYRSSPVMDSLNRQR
jgi:hypothetical protein